MTVAWYWARTELVEGRIDIASLGHTIASVDGQRLAAARRPVDHLRSE